MQNLSTDMLNDSNSTISSIPSDYEETNDSNTGFITAPKSTTTSKGQQASTDDRPTIDQNLVQAIVAARDSRRPETVEKETQTEEANVIMHFSPKLVTTLAQQDPTIQKVKKALKGTDEDRAEIGSYWRVLWRDLHDTADGCLSLDNRIVLPVSLQTPFLSYFHAIFMRSRSQVGEGKLCLVSPHLQIYPGPSAGMC